MFLIILMKLFWCAWIVHNGKYSLQCPVCVLSWSMAVGDDVVLVCLSRNLTMSSHIGDHCTMLTLADWGCGLCLSYMYLCRRTLLPFVSTGKHDFLTLLVTLFPDSAEGHPGRRDPPNTWVLVRICYVVDRSAHSTIDPPTTTIG